MIPLLQVLGGAGAALTATYQSSATATSTDSPHTFADMAVGAASTARTVVAFVTYRATTPITVSSATIGGVSATIDGQWSAGWQKIAALRATVPTGTTATVAVTLSGAITNQGIAVALWTVPGAISLNASNSAAGSGSAVALTCATGILIAASGSANSTSTTWTGDATEVLDISAGITKMSGASATVAAGSRSVTATLTGSPVDPITAAVNYVGA